MAKTAVQMVAVLLAALATGASASCDPSDSVINTQIRVDPGHPGTTGTSCYFPFSSSGTTYTDCTLYCDGTYCNYWCATSCNFEADSLWNYCKYRLSDLAGTNCSGLPSVAVSAEPAVLYGGTGNGTKCFFPFVYDGVCYYDCAVTSVNGDPWCATTDLAYFVSTNFKYCQYTLKGKNDPSCATIGSAAPYFLPPQIGNYSFNAALQTDQYGNCTFPFYYKDKCYDDCTTVDAVRWHLIWCSTEQYFQPNKKRRICPYYRKYQTYTGLALNWGFFRIYSNEGCGSGGPFCNRTLVRATSGVSTGFFGSPRIMLSSTSSDIIEVMPQGNGYFILRIPLPCGSNFLVITTDATDVVYDSVSIEREFWNILATGTPNVFTIQSTWNTTANQYISRRALSGNQVGNLDPSTAAQWRFEPVSSTELASLSLPCENATTNVNGVWCAWSSYTYSSTTATRNRNCSCPSPSGIGTACAGNSSETGQIVNGTWCSWTSYSVSGAYGTRTRDCNCSAPAFGGQTCLGSGNDTGLAVNASWCSWSSYTVSGAFATRTRNCSCPTADYGGSSTCPGSSNDTGLTVNGTWCSWSGYTVNGAYATRLRTCNCSAAAYAGADCVGSSNDTGLVQNGTWCAWSAYTVSGSFATRTRLCNCSADSYGGLSCSGTNNDTGAVVNGNWCSWSAYTITAGVGTRTRNCSCPDAAYAGATCSGASTDSLTQVNGNWCSWGSLVSGYGIMTRTRSCNCSAPNAIGSNCTGLDSENYPCNVTSCQVTTPSALPGGWCSWDSWVAGSVNSGVMSRSRSCGCPAPTGSSASCSGSTSESATCTLNGCIVRYAVPAESGTAGTSFIYSSPFYRIIIWGSVVGGSILVSGIVGLALMLRYIATRGA